MYTNRIDKKTSFIYLYEIFLKIVLNFFYQIKLKTD